MGITDPVVTCVGFIIESEFGICPVKLAGINNDAADTGAVSSHPFGKRVDHDIGTIFDTFQQMRCCKGCIDNQWKMVLVGNFGDRPDVSDLEQRVADGFNEDRPGFFRNCRFKVKWIPGISKLYLDTKLR